MTKAIINNNQTITSLELLEQINFFRKKEGKVKGRYFINTYHIKALEQAYSELKQKEFENRVVICTMPFNRGVEHGR